MLVVAMVVELMMDKLNGKYKLYDNRNKIIKI